MLGVGKLRKTKRVIARARNIRLGVLLSELKVCKKCRLGPVPLTFHNIIG